MKISAALLTLALAVGFSLSAPADAQAADKAKNLKVLKDTGKKLQKGMKLFTKGLGVKCKACHVKGKYESDDVANKVAGRKFLEAVMGEKDAAKKDAALKTLLAAMKMDAAKNPDKVWKGIGMFVKK